MAKIAGATDLLLQLSPIRVRRCLVSVAGHSVWDDSLLVEEVLRAARVDAFDWDLTTDHIERRGDAEAVFLLPLRDLGTTGAEFFRLVHPADRQRLRDAVESLTPSQPLLVHEYRIMLPDGQVRWYAEQARGEFAEQRLVRLRGLTIDITARAEAEERVRLLARISEMISASQDVAALLYDVSCAVGEHLNARRCLFTEIDLDADRGVVQRDYCRGVPSVAGVYRISDYSERTRGDMLAGRTVVNNDSKVDPRTAAVFEHTYAPNGERAYIAVPLLRSGRWVAELWISDDVPRPWSLQDVALIESVAERAWTAVEKLRVEREREDLLARERRLRAEADAASLTKDHFLALLSHELRTPMTTIVGWAAFLESGMADAESTARGIENILAASRTQARLIDDLLDVSRIVTGKLTLDTTVFDARDAALRAIEVTHADETPGIRLVRELGETPALVRGDATRIQQVIWNLLANALKFTPPGGEVTVRVAATPQNVAITVRDTGVGIEPEFLPHVFERFRQGDDGPSRRFGGLGLGLSLVRHLTELHGGSVAAASDGAGKGAEFVVTLPAAPG